MPPRKEPKEAVVYPSSKRKVPAYKPLKPSGVPRASTADSASSKRSAPPAATVKIPTVQDNDDDDHDDSADGTAFKPASKSSLDTPAPKRQKTAPRAPSSLSAHVASSDGPGGAPPDLDTSADPPMPSPSPSDDTLSVPQPLLLRLLHESFAHENSTIDAHALLVVRRYVDIFVREAIARARARKIEKAERGEATERDAAWLDLEDLEAVAPGLVLDF